MNEKSDIEKNVSKAVGIIALASMLLKSNYNDAEIEISKLDKAMDLLEEVQFSVKEA